MTKKIIFWIIFIVLILMIAAITSIFILRIIAGGLLGWLMGDLYHQIFDENGRKK